MPTNYLVVVWKQLVAHNSGGTVVWKQLVAHDSGGIAVWKQLVTHDSEHEVVCQTTTDYRSRTGCGQFGCIRRARFVGEASILHGGSRKAASMFGMGLGVNNRQLGLEKA